MTGRPGRAGIDPIIPFVYNRLSDFVGFVIETMRNRAHFDSMQPDRLPSTDRKRVTMTNSALIRPAWTPATIALMVIGFMVFWPLGLAMLAYILWGDRMPEIKRHFEGVKRDWTHECRGSTRGYSRSGNFAFDEYREREMKRLEEERRKLEEERREFESFMQNLRRARDQEEFDRFMRERNTRSNGDTDKTIDL